MSLRNHGDRTRCGRYVFGIEHLEPRIALSSQNLLANMLSQLASQNNIQNSVIDQYVQSGSNAVVSASSTTSSSSSGNAGNTSTSQAPVNGSSPSSATQTSSGSQTGNSIPPSGGSQPVSGTTGSTASSTVHGVSQSRQLAFAGASGFGAYARGGRGGDVYHVTNLNDRGPGSLREGITSASGPRTVVFDVSGTIDLSSRLIIDKPYLTLAGQTAPGDGITLRNFGTMIIDTHDVVIRYMRFRTGDTVVAEHDALLVYRSQDVMIDHVSASWGIDETLPVARSTNVTIQWSFITEGLHDSHHRKGSHSAGTLSYDANVSLHHNLFAHNWRRSPLVRQSVDIVNNVIYDWGQFGTMVGASTSDPFGPTYVNLVNNYYVAGPSTVDPEYMFLGYGGSETFASGNVLDSNQNGVRDGGAVTRYPGQSVLVSSRFDYPAIPTDDALTAYHRVLNEAGASLARDTVDERIVDEVSTDTGRIIDSQFDVGGWPVLQSRPALADSDQDGMPDVWENSLSRWYLDGDDSADGSEDNDGDGFTNLEDYLGYLASGGTIQGIGTGSTAQGTNMSIGSSLSTSEFQSLVRQSNSNNRMDLLTRLFAS